MTPNKQKMSIFINYENAHFKDHLKAIKKKTDDVSEENKINLYAKLVKNSRVL